MEEGANALAYAVRFRVLARHLGDLCVVTAALTGVPVAAALLLGDTGLLPTLAGSMAVLGLTGVGLRRCSAPPRVQANEALVIAAAIFGLTSLVGMLALSAAGLAPLDALFESVSAVTTTGLSTLSSVEGRPRTFLFLRAWMQWYGGLGIVVLALALVQGPGLAARRLGATAGEIEDLLGSTRLYARRVLQVYAALTCTGIGALWLLGADPFDALTYGLSAVSTGGFAPHDGSLAALPSGALRAAVIALSVAGATTLLLYDRAWREGSWVLWRDAEFRALCVLGVATSLVLGVLWLLQSGSASLAQAPLLAFSAQTTAGFSPFPAASLDPASKLLLIASMYIGGSVGSTAGGVKLVRLLVLVQLLRWTLLRARLPLRAVADPRLGGQRLEAEDVQRTLVLFGGFGMAAFASWLLFVASGYPALDSLFEVTSALGTVGLSAGIASPELPAFLKGVLCVDMLLGRLELVAVVVALAPRTWLGRRNV